MSVFARTKATLYNLCNWRLLNQLQKHPLPKHVAVITDENRRFARLQGLTSPSFGHLIGAEKLGNLIEWCDELALPVLTVWALSLDNLHRDPEKLGQLIEVMQDKLRDLTQPATQRNSARSVHVVGRWDMLPNQVQDIITDVETRTAHLGPFRLNIAVGYDGREEISEAVAISCKSELTRRSL